jgi:hypothetical protein
MSDDADLYDEYYAAKLWGLLPAVYRAEDSADFNVNGPLRGLVNRIGAQAAVLRRSIDRLWEDQSIEGCDDWVIPYIADLLATNLVANLDARGRRLDVAKTIYYRRRKGTLALLEEVAHDCTGWDVRCVEFFRRLARARHGLDPAIGRPADNDDPAGARTLQLAQGLVGPRTGTPLGGFADLRNVAGARRAGGPFDAALAPESRGNPAFDEFAHTADVRLGSGSVGWYNIPRLGVFLWRLYSFGLEPTTPVPVAGCPGPRQFTFDPTGRDVPLFAASSRAFGDAWTSPEEWQLPAPIRRDVLGADLAGLYDTPSPQNLSLVTPKSLGVYTAAGLGPQLIPAGQITADPNVPGAAFRVAPEVGRLLAGTADPGGDVLVTYHYGFSSAVGAGAFDRSDVEALLPPAPATVKAVTVTGGKDRLKTPLTNLATSGKGSIVVINDSLTYTDVVDVTNVVYVSLRARSYSRPVLRPSAGTPWTFQGAGLDSTLVLAGLFVSGIDLVLTGQFGAVILSCCTLDPGSAGQGQPYAAAADNRLLTPTRLRIQAEVRALTIDRSITGPVLVEGGGGIERASACDSIVQALGPDGAFALPGGVLALSRCTVLGPGQAHRIDVSECILYDPFNADDLQDGCVRFSAYADGSALPRPYESVAIPPLLPLFSSRVFGRPGYAQLLDGTDPAIAAGAEDGSEMGAFAREQNPIKLRGLRSKLAEFMPLGLAAVLIPVT